MSAWELGMVANGLAAVALLATAWIAFISEASRQQRYSSAFLFLTLGLIHWLHAIILAFPATMDGATAVHARALFVDWRLYAMEGLAGLAAVVYLVVQLRGVERERVARIRREDAMRRRHAVQVQDGVVQGLAAAKLALERGDSRLAEQSMADALEQAKSLLARWLPEGVEPALRDREDG